MLKALELAGFKSFADKTRFDFHDGITVVVGPNGSGKSNVVDAVKWVLGTQSAKSLRGAEMTDVIFNGSGSRGPLNTAEVTLVLDNRTGMYGGESRGQEVAITRRVYRSGEGEYLINGAACRLRDIRDLLADTGIGTEAYSIIEQGKVDALLQASPRDRRAIFEEAAGISRFRAKRQDAARRLARVEQNLLRLSDIVDEVESRLRSVRMQAGKAQRYRDGVKRLKDLRTEIGISDWFRLTQRIDAVAGELNSFAEEDTSRRDWMDAAEQELPQLDEAMRQAQKDSEQIDRQVAELREQVVRCQATLGGLANRHSDLEANIASVEEQWRAASTTDGETDSDHVPAAAKLAAARSEYDDATRQLADANQRLHEQSMLVARLTAQVDEIAARLASAENRLELTTHKLSSSRQRAAESLQQLDQFRREHVELVHQRDQLRQVVDSHRKSLEQVEQQLTESEQALSAARERQAGHLRQLDKARREYQMLATELESNRHRIELIGELDREQVATGQKARTFVSQALGAKPLVVADVLHVDVDTAPIIEAALGVLAEYVIVPSSSDLLQQLDSLPAGARLMRLDWRTPIAAIDQVDLSGEHGVWGRADQFVDSETEYQPLVRRLLGRTWIVDSLRTAQRLALATGHGLHFVTADGDVLGADGTLVAGRRGEARTTFTRRQNIEQLRQLVAQQTPAVEEARQQVGHLESCIFDHQQAVDVAMQQHRMSLNRMAEVREQLAAGDSRLQLTVARCDEFAARESNLEIKAQQDSSESTNTEQSVDALRQQREQLKIAYDELHVQQSSAEQECLNQREVVRRLEVTVGKIEQQVEVLDATAAQSASQGRTAEIRQELARQRETLDQRLATLERERLAATGSLAEHTSQLEVQMPRRDGVAEHRRSLESRRSALQQQLHAARTHIDDTRARRSQLELALAKLEHERQSLADRLRDDYEIDLPAVASAAPRERHAVDRKKVEQEINQIRDGLHRIGAVNVDALEELEEIESRFEAISAQYGDLSQAKASLERLMAKLNTESRNLFLSTVETVRGHFRELFRRLFGGGEADLQLEEYESDDAMDCGVEIRASPPGKETRTISLLSGGEKTMTCVALLLALFRSKPSPFCVLDEVDAALDEANVGRFTSVLSDFLSNTQFVVITHSKKTMTGANTLYGVTMQESGISKQVSVRFDDVTEDGFIKPMAKGQENPNQLPKAA